MKKLSELWREIWSVFLALNITSIVHCQSLYIKDESVIVGWLVFVPVEQGAELDNVEEDGHLRSRLIFKVGQLVLRELD